MTNQVDPSLCNADRAGKLGHETEYGKIGFSPCGEYVAHEINSPCNVINGIPANTGVIDTDECHCKTDVCPCGEFVSHKVSESCTAS